MLKIGVIGVGSMGQNHLRNIRELPQYYDLIGCYDECERNSGTALERYGAQRFSSAEALVSETDAVVLAVPSSLHLQYGLLAAQYEQHALIEKPIALSGSDGKTLCDTFSKVGKTLMVGHVERYNPVVSVMKEILKEENEIIAIDARRCSPFDIRISDTNVIFDLMIHDLDIVLNYLYTVPAATIQASAVVAKSNHYSDYVHATIQHETGVVSTVLASRVTEDKVRMIEVHTGRSLIRGDLLNKTLSVIRKTSLSLDLGNSPMYTQESIVEKIMLPNVEPLKNELIEFADAIMEGREALTSGKDATNALYIAESIHDLTKYCPILTNGKR